MRDQGTEYTLTIKSIDRNELTELMEGYKYKRALNDFRGKLRDVEKYVDLKDLSGFTIFEKLKESFWGIIEENEINLD
jgi:hypothetical protein